MKRKTIGIFLLSLLVLFVSITAFAVTKYNDGDTIYFGNNKYYLCNNCWGKGSLTGWSQSIYYNSDYDLGWSWNWPTTTGGVKSYPAIICGWHWTNGTTAGSGLPVQLSAGRNINTSVTYSYTNMSGVYNFAYDIWLHPYSNVTSSSTPSDEIMIWLNSTNAWPAGSQFATTTIDGRSWKVYQGYVSSWNVFSFVTSNTNNATLNIKNFTDYLSNNGRMDRNKYLTSVECGSEPTNGTGNCKITNYSVNVGGGSNPTPTPPPTGSYVKFRNVAKGLYIDGMGSASNGANACQWSSSSSYNQQWAMESVSGYYKIKNRATGLYLDGMGRTSNGSICGQWSSSSSNNQQWSQETVGSNVKYKNRATGLYLDGMGSTGNGSTLCQWNSSSSTNQQWQKQ